MNRIKNNKSISLYKWIWQSYIRTALLPLLIVELVFICIYFSSNSLWQKKTFNLLKKQAQNELGQIANQEADAINHQLSSITNSVMLFSSQMRHALSNSASLSAADYERLTYSKEGVYYSKKDTKDGGAAIFYSGIVPVKEAQRKKVAKVLTQQKLMADIKNTQPLATSIYFNTFDSLNIIYPYVDVISQYTPLANIPSYNFYYEANAEHNPEHTAKWTDIYLDPAGNGLITSAICPVYNNDLLEGVVGINMTMSTITNKILTMQIPWNGYSLLIGKDGTILSLPSTNTHNWDLNLLNVESYDNSIFQDTLNKNQFNLYKNNDLAPLSDQISSNTTGFSSFTLNGTPKVLSWATVNDTGWKLIIIVPEKNIYSNVYDLKDMLIKTSSYMILLLIASYMVFFIFLFRKSKRASSAVASSFTQINTIVQKISNGDYSLIKPTLRIKELNDVSIDLIKMGHDLGKTNENLLTTQSELKQKETDLKALVNSINDIILEVDFSGHITNLWSRARRDLYKLYVQGHFTSVYDLLDKDTTKIAKDKIRYVIKTSETATMDFNIQSNSGLKWFEASISPRLNITNRVVISVRDITEQKKLARSIIAAKEEAEKASMAKSEFLSSMSHELRTPLNAILGFSQILELDSESPLTHSQHQSVKEILKAGNHLLELINEVLDLAKIESGKLSISLEPVQIKSIIDETLAIIKPFANAHGISIVSYPIDDLNEFVLADNTRLKQILINLLSNAIKYNKPNGQVIFYHDRIDDKFRFHVIDTGIGLSHSDLNVIFKPFHRLNKINNSIEGTGIGLAVAKQLAELMNGRICVESEKGIGSHFEVELPYADSPIIQESENTVSTESESSFSKNTLYKVLYVEDNPANLRLVERILTRISNIEMFTATSGELCIDLAIALKPDLILLDINLPGIDGYEVLKRLKIDAKTNNIPVIAISAHAMPRDIEKGLSLGFSDYITKPINIQSFTEKISTILVNDRLKNEN